jgi:hypothetical protein
VVGVWAFPCADAPALYPFLAHQLDVLLARCRPHLLLCAAADSGVLAQVRRYTHVEQVGLVVAHDAEDVLIRSDGLVVFRDGCDRDGPALAAAAKRRGQAARLVRVPGGEVAHLPLWDDLVPAGGP